MFNIETTDRSKLKRIVAAGSGALVMGLALVGLNLVGPLFSTSGYDIQNVVFGFVGLIVVVFATHPTYQALERLDSD